MSATDIAVKRMQGLGNLLMLLPVLQKASADGRKVALLTRPEWIPLVEAILPEIDTTVSPASITCDLDLLTANTWPALHRTDEFARLLSVEPPFPALDLSAFSSGAPKASSAVVLAPEAGHPARRWPYSASLAGRLRGRPLWLVGLSRFPAIPCDVDLRGRLDVIGLVRTIAAARCVIAMDSAVLQVALATGTRAVAVFGGIDPAFRVRPEQNATVLVGSVPCRPCNKREICGGRFDCLRAVSVDDVIAAVDAPAQRDMPAQGDVSVQDDASGQRDGRPPSSTARSRSRSTRGRADAPTPLHGDRTRPGRYAARPK